MVPNPCGAVTGNLPDLTQAQWGSGVEAGLPSRAEHNDRFAQREIGPQRERRQR
jgi:hypothetical protein